MKDNDQKLIWETHHKTFQHRGNVPRVDHDDKATMYGKPVKDMVPTVAGLDKKYGKPDKKKLDEEEETYEERGQRGEGRSLLKALSSWIETARGDQLKRAYESILKAYQIAGYPDDSSGEEKIERDDDYRGEDPPPRETDQDRYGYQGDR